MLFKELKQNFPVYILDKDKMELLQGKVMSVSFPRMNTTMGKTEMVVDITIEVDGKSACYVIPEQSSVTYANNLVLATDKTLLSNEVESMKVASEQVLASVDKHKHIIEKSEEILTQLNPAFKEKQENDKRFACIESSMSDMKSMMEKQAKLIEQLLNRGL